MISFKRKKQLVLPFIFIEPRILYVDCDFKNIKGETKMKIFSLYLE